MIKAWDYQEAISEDVVNLLIQYKVAYLAMEERTGKSLICLLAAEKMPTVKDVLIITKKKAMGDKESKGWNDLIKELPYLQKKYTVTNYHSAHKVAGWYDLVILDEAHSYISGYPKTSVLWNNIYSLVWGVPIIYSSATPYAQGPQLLYHQFKLSKWSPWKQYKDFYKWFVDYAKRDKNGNLPTVRIGPAQTAIDYKCVDVDKCLADVRHLFITKTRTELGFEQEPEDQLHYVELNDDIKTIYNTILKHKYLEFTHSRSGVDYCLVCDSPIKLRWALHQLEGGVLKINDEYIDLGNDEKAEYVKQVFGDTKDLVIMYHYKADKIKLERLFKNATILQGISYAEGIDLSMYKHLVIYSQDFSTAKHTQRRARQANRNRSEEIKVHYILVRKAISDQVYKTVSINKRNFVDSVFEEIYL